LRQEIGGTRDDLSTNLLPFLAVRGPGRLGKSKRKRCTGGLSVRRCVAIRASPSKGASARPRRSGGQRSGQGLKPHMSASHRFEFRDPGYLQLFSVFFLPPPIFRVGCPIPFLSVSVAISAAELACRRCFSRSSPTATRSAARAYSVSLPASAGGFFSRSRRRICVYFMLVVRRPRRSESLVVGGYGFWGFCLGGRRCGARVELLRWRAGRFRDCAL
jgi:hypothetical protein